jgi:hypothetical protein
VVEVEILWFGIPAAVLVVVIVQGLKLLGLPVGLAAWAALGVSLALSALGVLVKLLPASEQFVTAFIEAVLVWLAATGIYEKGKDIRERIR